MALSKLNITPTSGTIIGTPYINSDSTFKSAKEEAGQAQMSTVVAVGEEFTDQGGVLRTPPCKVGQIIIHSAVRDDREVDYQEYRFIEFYMVKGIYQS